MRRIAQILPVLILLAACSGSDDSGNDGGAASADDRATLLGKIVTADGRPFDGACRILVYGPGDAAEGDAPRMELDSSEPTFQVPALDAGTYRIDVRAADRTTNERCEAVVALDSGDNEVGFKLVAGASIQGRVTDNGQPAADVTVTVFDVYVDVYGSEPTPDPVFTPVMDLRTDAEGAFLIDWILPGKKSIAIAGSAETIDLDAEPGKAVDLGTLEIRSR